MGTQRILGTACVRMTCAEDAAAALNGMNKASIKGKVIYCKYALDKSKKLAFHKPPPDRRLREQYYINKAARANETNIEPNTIESIVEQAMKHVFSNPQIQQAVQSPPSLPISPPITGVPMYPKQQQVTRTAATSMPNQIVSPKYPAALQPTVNPAHAQQLRNQAIAANLQQHLAAQQEKWKKRIDQKTNPGAAEYNPAVDTTAYNPLLDSTITMNTTLPTTKRFHPYGT